MGTPSDIGLLPGESDVFGTDLQGAFMTGFGVDLASGVKSYANSGYDELSAIDPTLVIDRMVVSLEASQVDQVYIDSVQELKYDADVLSAIQMFSSALDGQADITSIASSVLPPDTPALVAQGGPTPDPGMSNVVSTGQITDDGKNVLNEFSKTVSGVLQSDEYGVAKTAYSAVNTIYGVTKKSQKLSNFYKCKKAFDQSAEGLVGVSKTLATEQKAFFDYYGATPDDVKAGKGVPESIRSTTLDNSLKKIDELTDAKVKLTDETNVRLSKVKDAELKLESKKSARDLLVGVGASVVSTGLSVRNTVGSVQEMKALDEQRENGTITEDEYYESIRYAQLDVAQGTLGIGEGFHQVGTVIGEKILKDSATTTAKQTKFFTRFASAVGGAIAIGSGVASLTQNAMKAHQARTGGNIGGAAMYGVMAALDGVGIVLDGVSMALDFIPGIGQAISLLVDVLNTVVGLVNMLVGFFADMVDTRTPQQVVEAALDDYIESPEFQKFFNEQANYYKAEGYDIFTYIIDAKAAGIANEDLDVRTIDRRVTKGLSSNAVNNFEDPTNRIAMVANTDLGQLMEGALGNDYLDAGRGDDKLFGDAGDDILLGNQGADSLNGGTGNDFLHGGVGRDVLEGGEGDDTIVYVPGFTSIVEGGPGQDTGIMNWDLQSTNHVQTQWTMFTDISSASGRTGLTVGYMFKGWENFRDPLKYYAWPANYGHSRRVEEIYLTTSTGQQEVCQLSALNSTPFWYLTRKNNRDYFTDGDYLYVREASNVDTIIKMTQFHIGQKSRGTYFNYSTQNNTFSFRSGQQVAGILYLFSHGTSTVTGMERILVDKNISGVGLNAPTHIVGSSHTDSGVYDMGTGNNSVLYSGNGNNVISITGARPFLKGDGGSTNPHKFSRLIINGEGTHTLMVNGGEADGNNFRIVDYVNPPQLGGGTNDKRGVVFINSVASIHCTGFMTLTAADIPHRLKFQVYNHSESSANHGAFHLTCTRHDDTVYVKRLTGAGNHIDAGEGHNVLSLEYAGGDGPASAYTHQVDLDAGTISGNMSATISGFETVRAGSYTTTVRCHSTEDNCIIMRDGGVSVYGGGGSDMYQIGLGNHLIYGGTGASYYKMEGREVKGFVTFTVWKDDHGTVEVKSLINAELIEHVNYEVGTLKVAALAGLKTPHCNVTAVRLCDAAGATLTGKGSVSASYSNADERWYLVLTLGSDFDYLVINRSFTGRIEYTVEGGASVEVITKSLGNCLDLSAYNDDVRIVMTKRHIQFWTSDGAVLIFSDWTWRNIRWVRFVSDNFTNVYEMVSFFSQHYTQLLFANAKYEGPQVWDYVFSKVKHMIPTVNPAEPLIDNIVDGASHLPNDPTITNCINLGHGDNYVTAVRDGYTYKGGQGNDTFDCTQLASGHSVHLLKEAYGANVVAVGPTGSVNVDIDRGVYLFIYGYRVNDITVQLNADNRQVFTGSSGANNLTVTFKKQPANILFHGADNTSGGPDDIVNNVYRYVSLRKKGEEYFAVGKQVGLDGKLYMVSAYSSPGMYLYVAPNSLATFEYVTAYMGWTMPDGLKQFEYPITVKWGGAFVLTDEWLVNLFTSGVDGGVKFRDQTVGISDGAWETMIRSKLAANELVLAWELSGQQYADKANELNGNTSCRDTLRGTTN